MKVRKYGNFELAGQKNLYFGILVATGKGWEFITKIDSTTKTWEVEKMKRPYLFDSRTVAQDFVCCLMHNYTTGYVVEMLSTADNIASK